MSNGEFGLAPGYLQALRRLFERWPSLDRVWVLGSRARGDYRGQSDVWHRNVARAHYGLQGWRRDRVYPDFVFLRTTRAGKPVLVVMETKGAFLKNEDTDYKKNLLATLTEAYSGARFKRAGELELAADGAPRIVCDLVFDENWKNALTARHFSVD